MVTHDLRETGGPGIGRELVNYGHTFGHAVERVENYGWRHGDAVSVGMVYVAELSRLTGRLDPSVVARHRSILSSLGLPISYPAGRWSQLHDAMRMDKKSRGDRLRFVVLEDVARARVLESPDPALLEAAYVEVSR